MVSPALREALSSLRSGGFVLIHDSDSRENETDLVAAAQHVDPEKICVLRRDAGGLLCAALGFPVASALGLPYLTQVLRSASRDYPVLGEIVSERAPYGGPPAFSVTVNHRDSFTGVSDVERARTVRRLAEVAEVALRSPDEGRRVFVSEFYSPGHVHLLVAARGLLRERRGHTELSVFLAGLAGLTPVTVLAEMLSTRTHRAMGRDEVLEYSRLRGVPFVEGSDILEAFQEEERGVLGV